MYPECDVCGGPGWLWDQEYGYSYPAEVRDDEIATPVQRCDSCRRWDDDWEAAQMCLAWDFDGDGVVVWGVRDCACAGCELDDVETVPLDVFVITVKENL